MMDGMLDVRTVEPMLCDGSIGNVIINMNPPDRTTTVNNERGLRSGVGSVEGQEVVLV